MRANKNGQRVLADIFINTNQRDKQKMNIDQIKFVGLKKIAAMFSDQEKQLDNGMIGKYVIVRCRDAGVHAGFLESHNGRECVLTESRRLWYWKPANGATFLSGVASEGLHADSKIGAPVKIHLTENCEIIQCSGEATKSIMGIASYEK